MTDFRHWLLLIYRVPQDPPGRRTAVWRQIKQLGAVNLQQAAVILPDLPHLRVALDDLARRIVEFEGEASLLETRSPSSAWESGLIRRFSDARNGEYGELEENVERFEDEITREIRKERFRFAQLEDLEAEWEKLQRWRDRIVGRDFFDAPGQVDAQAALERGRAALEQFTARVYQHEGVETGAGEL